MGVGASFFGLADGFQKLKPLEGRFNEIYGVLTDSRTGDIFYSITGSNGEQRLVKFDNISETKVRKELNEKRALIDQNDKLRAQLRSAQSSRVVAKNNNELVNNFANFVHRSVVLTNKYWGGIVPEKGELTSFDEEVLNEFKKYPSKISNCIEKHRYKEALSHLMKLSALGNKYLTETEPWQVIKTDEKRVKTILNIALQITASLGVLSSPFLPKTSEKLLKMLNLESLKWKDLSTNNINAGCKINQGFHLFSRMDEKVIDEQRAKLDKAKQKAEASIKNIEPQKEITTFDEFQKMDIRVGTIVEAHKIKKAKKLLKLKIDTGIDQRTVVSGIAQFFNPEDIIGRQVSILVNLAPRKMLGIESEGMILMAENNKGELQFVAPIEPIDNGSVIA